MEARRGWENKKDTSDSRSRNNMAQVPCRGSALVGRCLEIKAWMRKEGT